ncbi:hypothetical protein Tco_0063048, partial [Tanacetum coccineum]
GEEVLLTLEVPTVKNSSYKGPKRRSNSCCDGAVVYAEGETLRSYGAGLELSMSDAFCYWGTRPEVLLSTYVSVISLISSNLICATKDVKHAVTIASAQKNKGSLEAESIV